VHEDCVLSSLPLLQLKKRFSNRQEAKEDETEAKETGASSSSSARAL